MEYNIRDIIALSDGNNYEIISITNHNDEKYYLLAESLNGENVKFCKEKSTNNELILDEIEDQELMITLLPKFTKEVVNLINKDGDK